MTTPTISTRKDDHLTLCAEAQVEFRQKTTLLEEVELLHDALPELSVAQINLSSKLVDRALAAPLLITGMTGGAERASSINRELARVAQELGIAFGVGSQRAILRHPELARTYQVRDVAPDVVLLGNIGGVQAAQMSTAQARDLIGTIDADALCVHLNPGQELLQPEGDRDFQGVLDGITRLIAELGKPVIIKETGCGLSYSVLDRLSRAGATWVDTSGAGGTTWIGVETLRTPPAERNLGEQLWEWGIPTAASVVYARNRGLSVIASGGLRHGLDAARAIALGADVAGMALPWLRSVHDGGADAALAYGHSLIASLRAIFTLTGSASITALQHKPHMLGPKLTQWLKLDPRYKP